MSGRLPYFHDAVSWACVLVAYILVLGTLVVVR